MDREELLRSARNLYENPGTNEALKVVLEETYPELQESEDERIRKELVNFILYKAGHLLDEETEHKFIAYLEKQKEQKPLSTEETELNSIAFLEQLGYTCVPPGADQKPAEWSEEDKMKIVELKTFIAKCNGFNKANRQKAFELIDSLRPQPHWKPSEEQMEALDNARFCKSYDRSELDSLYTELKKQYDRH